MIPNALTNINKLNPIVKYYHWFISSLVDDASVYLCGTCYEGIDPDIEMAQKVQTVGEHMKLFERTLSAP